jgi:hypothetical protein
MGSYEVIMYALHIITSYWSRVKVCRSCSRSDRDAHQNWLIYICVCIYMMLSGWTGQPQTGLPRKECKYAMQ